MLPYDQEILTGATVVLTLGTPIIALAVPCRIVSVIDGQTQWGFAYGTLPGHPEQGEEAFIVSIAPDQTVRFEIKRFPVPGDRSSDCLDQSEEAFKRVALGATCEPSSDSSMRTLTSP